MAYRALSSFPYVIPYTVWADAIRIADMPVLGEVTESTFFVGEHAGSGLFSATALRNYIINSNGPLTVARLNISDIPLAKPDGSPPDGALKGDLYDNGGFVCIAR